jgi:hypothetical protein
VDSAQDVIKGIQPDELRAGGDLRAKVAETLGQISQTVEGMMVERPKRAIKLED